MPFVVAGLVTGATYGLLAVGLVLIFRATNVLNFAHTAIGTLGAYVFAGLALRQGNAFGQVPVIESGPLPVALALPVTLLLAGLFGAGLYYAIFHRIGAKSALTATIATVVLGGLVIEVVAHAWNSVDPAPIPKYFPDGGWYVFDVFVSYRQAGAIALAVLVAAALAVWLRSSTLGLSLRALSDNRTALSVLGINAKALGALAWGLGSVLATMAVILLAPDVLLFPSSFDAHLATAFGAALLGGLRNPAMAVVGGLVIGVAEGLLAKNFESAGLRDSAAFLLILVLLFSMRRQIIGAFSFTEGEARA